MNYYMLDCDGVTAGAGYSRGALLRWTGSAWAAVSPPTDLLFSLAGAQETSDQLGRILAAQPLLGGTEIAAPSGVFRSPYAAGDHSLAAEAEALLAAGDSHGRRLLALVDPERLVRIYPAPALGEADWTLDRHARLRDATGQAVPPWRALVGHWVRLSAVIPGSADTSRLADPSRFFVERAAYDPALPFCRLYAGDEDDRST